MLNQTLSRKQDCMLVGFVLDCIFINLESFEKNLIQGNHLSNFLSSLSGIKNKKQTQSMRPELTNMTFFSCIFVMCNTYLASLMYPFELIILRFTCIFE